MASFPIPLATLAPGTYTFPAVGGYPLADTDTGYDLTVDRTVAGGFNAVTAAVTMRLSFQQSGDGGATWNELASDTIAGGIYAIRGVRADSNDIGGKLWAGTGRQGRGVVTVTGGSVAVQGQLVIS